MSTFNWPGLVCLVLSLALMLVCVQYSRLKRELRKRLSTESDGLIKQHFTTGADREIKEICYRHLVESTRFGIMLVAANGKILSANQTGKRITGLKNEDLEMYDLCADPQLVQTGLVGAIQQAFQGTIVELPEVRYVRRTTSPSVDWENQPELAVKSTVYPILRGEQDISEIAVIIEITDAENAELLLRDQETKLQLLTDSIPNLVWTMTPATNESWRSKRWYDYTGTTVEEINKNGWICVVPPSERDTITEKLRRHFKQGKAWEELFRIRNRDGEYKYHLSRGVPLKGEDDQVKQWIGTATDVSEVIEAREQLQLAVKISGIGMVTVNYLKDSIIPDQLAAQILGLKPFEGVSAKTLHSRFHMDDRERVLRSIQLAKDRDGTGELAIEHRIVLPDGILKWISIRMQVHFGVAGAESAVLAVADITKRKEIEIALARSELYYRSVFERSEIAIAEVNPSTGRFLRVNAKFCQKLGYTEDELLSMTVYDVTYPDDVTENRNAIDRFVDNKASYELEKRYIRKDGTVFWGNVNSAVMGDGILHPLTILGTVVDISERKRREQEKLNRELRFRLFTEESPTLDFVKNYDGNYLYVNRSFCRTIGHSEEDCLGKNDFQLFPHSVAAIFREHDLEVLESGTPKEFLETAEFNQTTKYYRSFKFPQRMPNGDVNLAGLCVDVTDHYERERELREENETKNRFMAMLAHELRNPLAPIKNVLQIFVQKPALDPELIYVRDVIERQVDHISRLLEDLIDLSRISKRKLKLRIENVTLSKVVASALEASRPLIDAAGHTLSVDLPNDEITIEADELRLAQVITNLLNNSAKYTHDGGRIELKAERREHEIEITIKDNGVGLAKEMLTQVFDEFWQSPSTTTMAKGGLGMGLALAKKLVILHGGTINCHSGGEGQGCLFTILLPDTHRNDQSLFIPAVEAKRPISVPPRKILVVDDNEDSADSMSFQLELKGHCVRTAYCGKDALTLCSEFDPDVAILDLGMPEMSGYEVARRIRSTHHFQQILLIAMTGWSQPHDHMNSKDAGYDYHLTKPVDLRRLDSILLRAERVS